MVEKQKWTGKRDLADELKGGVIMDVTTPGQAKIAEEAGACAVMALEKLGIVRETTGRKRGRVFTYTASLKILSEGTEPL